MKNRSLVLGLFAMLLAGGGNFVFANVLFATQVWVKISSAENPAFHCYPTSLECSNSGTALCAVLIEIDTSPGTYRATDARKYPSSTCLIMKNVNYLQQSFNPTGETVEAVAPIGQP